MIEEHHHLAWSYMSVPFGYGSSTLDFLFSIHGFLLAVETKIVGKKPTGRQSKQIKDLIASGAAVLVIDQENLMDFAAVAQELFNLNRGFATLFSEESRDEYAERANAGNYKS